MYMGVLNVQLAAREIDIFSQMTNQLSTQSSIMKNIYIYYSGFKADTFNIHIRHF